jgi:hypothetical protein
MKDLKFENIKPGRLSHTRLIGESHQGRGERKDSEGEGVNDMFPSYTLKYISLTDIVIKYLVGW